MGFVLLELCSMCLFLSLKLLELHFKNKPEPVKSRPGAIQLTVKIS